MDVLVWLESFWPGRMLRGSGHAYMVVNAAHILGIGLLIGAVVPLDLRLLGVIRAGPLQVIGPFLSRCAAVGLALALATGLMLWLVRPAEYLGNAAFQWKLGLLALALATVGLQHLAPGWREAVATGRPGPGVRIRAAVSLLTWPAVLVAGRWIGFL
jgi:hypothetical protein